jgi:hypothetical protein
VNDRRTCGAERRDRERHGEAMVVFGVDFTAAQPVAAAHVEAVRALVNLAAHPPQPVRERGDSIALFDAQFLRSAHTQLAAVRGQRGEHGQLVDDSGNLFGHDLGRLQIGMPHVNRADRFAGLRVRDHGLDPCAHPFKDADDADSRRVESHVLDRHIGPGKRRRGDHPERGRRNVAGYVKGPSNQPLAAAHGD